MTIDATPARASADDAAGDGVYVEEWGEGARVVLVHGSLATGAEEWDAQRPLGELGYRLSVFDRRGHGRSPGATGEDYLVDADDIVELMGDGAHLVGHSYGGLGAIVAAARRPDATRSLTLLEAPVRVTTDLDPAWKALVDEIDRLWHADVDDEQWVVRFLTYVGSDPDEFPPEMLALALPLVPVCRRGRPFYDAELPLADVAAAGFPKVVVSGGHSPAFEGMCDALARHIGARRLVVEGAGHEIQFTGQAINDVLVELWRTTE